MKTDVNVKLFLDDVRNPPDESWVVVRSYQECIDALTQLSVSIISLDHDLGEDKTGYDVVLWIEKQVHTNKNYHVPVILVHSANPVGRKNIERAIESIMDVIEDE